MIKTRNKSIITLLILMALIAGFGRLNKLLEIKSVEAAQLPEITKENQLLKDKLEASRKIETPEIIRQIVLYYIDKYFKAEHNIAEAVFACESNLNPYVIHKNKNGSVDRGVAQINSSNRSSFENTTKMGFDIYSHDIETNIKYAKWLRDNSSRGWGNWVCYGIIKDKLASK